MKSWKNAVAVYRDPKMAAMLVLGMFSAIPFVLVFSTMSFWLSDCGVGVKAVAAFSLVRLPYSFKFLWAPYIDHTPLPFLTKRLGQRKSWAILFQICLLCCLIALVHTDPLTNPAATGIFAVLIAFFSASQDVVFDALRIECFEKDNQAAAAATYIFGYRVGMLIAGAGALSLSDMIGWVRVYEVLAVSGVLGVFTVLCLKTPAYEAPKEKKNFFQDAVAAPIKDFLKNQGWLLIVLFIITYKLCETTIGTVTPKLYKELGFSNLEIAAIVKLWGVAATIAGGFLGGILVVRFGLFKSLFICGILQGFSNLPFAVLSVSGNSMFWLTVSIVSDNMAAGMATTAFVAYMSSLCNTAYTATQYALLSSLTALPRDLLSSGSGWLVVWMGWPAFFVFTAFLSLPGLGLLWLLNRRFPQKPRDVPSEDIS